MFAAGRKLAIQRLTTRKHTILNRDYLFLEIETDGGITGIGEGSISGRVEIVEKAIQWFAPFLTGMEPGGIEDHWNRNYYQLSRYRNGTVLMTALAAIDIALWDIQGKRLGEPVWKLLGTAEMRTVQDGARSNSHRCLRATPEFSTAIAAARFGINLPARAAINRWCLRR